MGVGHSGPLPFPKGNEAEAGAAAASADAAEAVAAANAGSPLTAAGAVDMSTPQEGGTGGFASLLSRSMCEEFDAEELTEATDGWSQANVLGKGAFGTVYKGQLRGRTVAVKRLQEGGKQGRKEYETELDVLGRIHNPHIVQLLGHCSHDRSLVYEFLPGGSLSDRLNPSKGHAPLSPVDRVRMLAEVTAGLLYLHENTPPIVHRDLKPDNVLIDERGACKLGDVGLARLVEDAEQVTFRVAGTVGYIDPETMSTFKIAPSIDVYALGLIMLQLVTGERAVTKLHRHINDKCGFAEVSEGEWLERAADAVLTKLDESGGAWPDGVARGLAVLGLQCASRSSEGRPGLLEEVLPRLCALLGSCETCP